MIKRSLLYIFILVTQSFISCSNSRPALQNHYRLEPEMVINESGCGYGTWVADEQNEGTPKTFWNGYDKELCKDYKAALVLSLFQKVQVTDVYIYASEDLEITITAPLDKSPIAKNLNSGWNKVALNVNTDYIKIALVKGKEIGEILVDAATKYRLKERPKSPATHIIMDQFIGTNAFVDVPLGLLEPFGCIREYHDWPDWSEPQKDTFTLNASPHGFDFALYYKNLDRMGKLVVPTLQKAPKWLTEMQNVQSRPVPKGAKTDDPLSYQRHAIFMHQYAQNFHSASNGNIQYYENWNEPDKWWEYPISYFSPYQYASMSSADADGHLKKINGVGVRGAGSSKLVMAGLANPKIDYLHALKHWCDQNRKGSFAWDVINYHRYSNSCGLPDKEPKEGICPEKGNVYGEAKEIVAFRDHHLPGVEVWISEFGYDTEKSPQQCAKIGDKNTELVQADWLIRSYLLLAAAKIDKAFQFMIRDFGKEGLYATSGLYTSTLKTTPYIRPSWYYINTLKGALQGSYFKSMEVDSVNQVYKQIYVHEKDPDLVTTIMWVGSQKGKTVPYKLDKKRFQGARMIQFSPNQPCGKVHILNNATIQLTETPIILQQHPQKQFSKCEFLKRIEANTIKSTDINGIENKILLDEQTKQEDPLHGLPTGNPATIWKSSYNKGGSDGIIFYLPTQTNVHALEIFDGAGTGELHIFIKKEDDWTLVDKVSMSQYNKWKTCSINTKTKEIKIEKIKGSPDVGEIIFYEKVSE